MNEQTIGGLPAGRWIRRRVRLDRRDGAHRPKMATLVSVDRNRAEVKPDGHPESVWVEIRHVRPWWAENEDLAKEVRDSTRAAIGRFAAGELDAETEKGTEDMAAETKQNGNGAAVANGTNERNRLIARQSYLLAQWVDRMRDALLSDPSDERAAALASHELKWAVTAANVRTAREAVELEYPTRLDDTAYVASELVRLLDQLGQACPDRLRAIATGKGGTK